MEGCIAKAIYDFPKEADSDLALKFGDIVKITKQINIEWCFGTNGNRTGQFPTAFVKVVLRDSPTQVYIGIADYLTDEIGDIRFHEGDIIGLKEEVDDNWVVCKSDTSEGLCPKSFLKEIKFEEEDAKEIIEDGVNGVVAYGESIDLFNAQGSEELSFPKGVRIDLVKEIDSFWTEGIFEGKRGKFPSSFIKVVAPLPAELQFKETDSFGNGEGSNDAMPCAKALYFYVGTTSDELSFDKGEVITLIEKVNKEWYKGEIGKSVGLFPANHVDVIVDLPFETGKNLDVVAQTEKDDSSKYGLLTTNNLVEVKKPALKPKPLIKPKVSETANKNKPLLLKSSKQHQRNQAPRKEPKGNVHKHAENHNGDKKPEMPVNGNQQVTDEEPDILKAKNTQKPSRPPSFNIPSGQILSEQRKKPDKSASHEKALSNVAEWPPRPKSIGHSAKPPALENDMPLLSSNKHIKKFEAKTKNTSQLISPSLKLLESELDSADLRNEIKFTDNSTFYVSNENPIIINEDVKEKPKIKPKRPAPERPQGHPSKEQIFIDSKIYNEESLSPKFTSKGKLSRHSPSGSPNLLRSKEIEKQQVLSRKKPSIPSLPKPLAPQPPHKPLVPPKSQKSDEQLGAEKLSFDGVFQSPESAVVNGGTRSTVGKQVCFFYLLLLLL